VSAVPGGGRWLHCVVPDLLQVPTGWRAPRLRRLESLLVRGRSAPGPLGLTAALFDAFEVPPEARVAAPWRRMGSGAEPGPEWVAQAHPVHFRPDRDRLLLFPLHREPEAETAQALAHRFDDHFSGKGLRLEIRGPGRWFLVADTPQEVRFTALSQVPEVGLERAMPQGTGARFWRQVLTETQMLVHGLMEARRGVGTDFGFNGLWFDDAGVVARPLGRAPEWVLPPPDDPLALGLSAHVAERAPDRRLLLATEVAEAVAAEDPDRWRSALNALESALETEIARGVEEIRLDACDGRRRSMAPRRAGRFWRRRRPLERIAGR